MNSSKLLIHYGSDYYDIAKFRPIKNRPEFGIKPSGGLWVSPLDSPLGWVDFCEKKEFDLQSLSKCFVIKVRPTTKVYTIDCYKDLASLPRISGTYNIDFEAVAKKYNAIYLTFEGYNLTLHSTPMNLFGWDCECLLIMDKFCFTIEDQNYKRNDYEESKRDNFRY